MIKTFTIIILSAIIIGLVFFITQGAFCHLDYIKPNNNNELYPSYLT